jgi:hypothetical protein
MKGVPRIALHDLHPSPRTETDIALGDLTDVSIASPTNAQVLTFDSATGQWRNLVLVIPPQPLEWLTDVLTSSPATGDALVWDNVARHWHNAPVSTSLAGLTDCTIASPVLNQVLTWNGTKWVNQNPPTGGGGGSSTLAGLTDVNISAPADAQVLTYDGPSSKWMNKPSAGGGGGSALNQYYYDVMAYGGVGDGVTDDVAHIEAACAAAETGGGGVVVFPANKTFFISRAINWTYSNTALLGLTGVTKQSIITTAAGAYSAVAVAAGAAFNASGLTFKGIGYIIACLGASSAYLTTCVLTATGAVGHISVQQDSAQVICRYCTFNTTGASANTCVSQTTTGSIPAVPVDIELLDCIITGNIDNIANLAGSTPSVATESVRFVGRGGRWTPMSATANPCITYGNTLGNTTVTLSTIVLVTGRTNALIIDGNFTGNGIACDNCYIMQTTSSQYIFNLQASKIGGAGNDFNTPAGAYDYGYATSGCSGIGFAGNRNPKAPASTPVVPSSGIAITNNRCSPVVIERAGFDANSRPVYGGTAGPLNSGEYGPPLHPGESVGINYTTLGTWVWRFA